MYKNHLSLKDFIVIAFTIIVMIWLFSPPQNWAINYFSLLCCNDQAYDSQKNISSDSLNSIVNVIKLLHQNQPWYRGESPHPWYLIICDKEKNPEAHQIVLNALWNSDIKWAKNAPVFIVVITEPKKTKRGNRNISQSLWVYPETSAVALSIAIAAKTLGLIVNDISEFNKKQLAAELNIRYPMTPISILTIGHEVKKDSLISREQSSRASNIFEGKWRNLWVDRISSTEQQITIKESGF